MIAESRLSGLDDEERAADRTEAKLSESLREMAFKRLASLDHALKKAEQGRLDRCEQCGGAIPVARLRAMPGTTCCVACARAAGR